MSRKIKLYGQLAEFVGHKELDVCSSVIKTPANAVRFLISNFKGLEKHISENKYQVKVGDYCIDENEFLFPTGESEIHFIPVISGSGGGLGRVFLGVAMIGFAFATGGVSLGAGGLTFGTGTIAGVGSYGVMVSKALVYGGGLLALSGAAQMLSPQPQDPDFASTEDPRISFNFSGVQNVTRAGTPIPIIYGEIFAGSVVISAQIDTIDVEE